MNCGTYLYLPEEYSLFIQIFILYFVMRREQRFAKMQIFAYDFKSKIGKFTFSQKKKRILRYSFLLKKRGSLRLVWFGCAHL